MMPTLFNKTLLAGLGSILLTLSASTIATETEYGTVVPAGAKAGDLSMFPCEIYMEGDDRNYAGDCGTLIVPENRLNPDSRLIALPVSRIKATGDTPLEPIFWFEGGPGGSNTNLYPTDGILERHDFVMVGYRGIDGQVVLECPEIAEAVSSVETGIFSDESLDVYAQGTEKCVSRMLSEGIDLDGYTINHTIDDNEAARIALGYERINLYGNSYGTRVEMLYQWRHPDSIKRVLMMAVNPPGHMIFDADTSEQQIGQYAALCAKDSYCSSRTDDLVATMKSVSNNMPTRWMGISIDADAVRFITFASLMESVEVPGEPVPLNFPAAIDMWLDAAEGDASGMALVSLLNPLFLPSLGARPHSFAMAMSTPELSENYKAAVSSPDTLLGSPLSLFNWGLTQKWPVSSDLSVGEVQDSDIETLLINGTIDGSTPVQFGRDELLPHLSNGHFVELSDIGHTESFWNSQPQARARLINTFFDSGEVDDSLYVYQAPVFEANKTWGEMAKVTLAIAVAVFAILLFLIVFIVRKFRKKPQL